jgi:predicted transcriptional regulator
MKEVKKQVKKMFLLDIIKAIKEGNNLAQISKEKNITKQKLNYYIRQLKEQGMIRKLGYGVWETTERSKNLTKDYKEVRGHAFLWKVKLPKIRNWLHRITILNRLKIPYKLIGTYKKTPRILFKDRKIWLGNNYLIIYEPQSFMGKDAIESQNLAIWSLKQLLEALESKLKVSFKINGTYKFKVSRQHYALIKNLIARQYNKEGKKLNIFHDGKLWFIIDNSYNLDEAETVHPDTALIDNKGFQNYMNSHKSTDFKVTPDFVLTVMNGIQQNQLIFDRNMKSHLSILKRLGETVAELKEAINKWAGYSE